MWGHYAEQFFGLCLCFEHDLAFTPEDAAPLYPIQYWKENPPRYSGLDFLMSTTISNYVHLQRKSGRTYDDQTLQQLEEIAHEKLKLAATSKSYDWSYEEEFRLVSVRKEPQYLRVPLKLKGVIFGPKATTDTRNQVMKQLGADYTYSDMKLKANSYGYERIAISANSAGTVLK